jgi:carboxypeptidase C (cathepsin A)
MRSLVVGVALAVGLTAATAVAQVPAKGGQQPRRGSDGAAATSPTDAPAAVRQLPADAITAHALDLPGRTLKFTATAGSIALRGSDGKLSGEIASIAYQLDGADPLKRPVTFAFNGGPGSASAWVHIGGFGPWRLALEGAALVPSAVPALLPNAETWLDFTDLVFIDPAGTGFSRAAAGNTSFYSVDGDVSSVAEAIALWLRKVGRTTSPKFILGESYGGIRAPRVVTTLQQRFGVGMNGIILVSPLMDFSWFRGARHHAALYVNTLPTIAASALEAAGKPPATRAGLAAVEAYARGDYLADLMRGPRDKPAFERVVKRVSEISGLPELIVRSHGGRLSEGIYLAEAFRATGRRGSGYDATITGLDPDASGGTPSGDPFGDALSAPMKGAMLGLYDRLKWKPELLEYELLARDVNANWNWGSGGSRSVESFSALRSAMAVDPTLRVLVTHGFTDLRTPYFASVLLLEQLPPFADDRVTLQVYPGGHMHYSRDASRVALRRDAQSLIEAVIAADAARK